MKTLTWLFSLLLIGTAVAQKGTVVYTQQFSFKKLNSSVNLVFNNDNSLYYYDRSEDGSYHKEMINTSGYNYSMQVKDQEGLCIYKNASNAEMIARDVIWDHYFIVKETIPAIQWQSLPDKKRILNYDCQRAVGTYRGRTYRVWYAPGLPMRIGPWKLGGLPGIILEAVSDDGGVQFVAQSISLGKLETQILPPKNGKQITWEQFKKTDKEATERKIASLQAKMNPDGGSDVKFTFKPARIEIYE